MKELWQSLAAAMHRAVLAVGVLPALLTLAVAGPVLAAAAGEPLWWLLAVFGAFGSAEVFHRQRKAQLVQLRGLPKEPRLLDELRGAHPGWKVKVLKQFHHGGLLFRVGGFEELEIPLSVTPPLCPRCGGGLAERREARFPGRTRIEHRCACGFAQRSPHTLGELYAEAHQMAGCPE